MIITLENTLFIFEQTVRKYSGDIPHYISMPVLRLINDKIHLVSFVYFYDGKIYSWVYCDVDSDGNTSAYFTNPDINALFIDKINPILNVDDCKHKNMDYMNHCSQLLHDVTENIVRKKIIDYKKYQKYLHYMLQTVPEAFSDAYIAFSSFTEDIDDVISTVTWLPNNIDNLFKNQKEEHLSSYFSKLPYFYLLLSKKERKEYKCKPFVHSVDDKKIVYFCQDYKIAKYLANVFGLTLSDGTPLVTKIAGCAFEDTVQGLNADFIALGAVVKQNVVTHPLVLPLANTDVHNEYFEIDFPRFTYLDFRESEFVSTPAMTKEDFFNADVLYVIFNPLTESFYIDDNDCAVICTNMEDAHACVTILGNRDGSVNYVQPIFPSSFGRIFNTLFYYDGFAGISVNPFSHPFVLRENDIEKLEENNQDEFHNPKLKLAIRKYHQKRNILYFKEIKEKILNGAQTILEECLEKSSLLIPVYKEEDSYYHPLVYNEELDIDAIPCFTDWIEYSKMYSNTKYQAVIVPGNELWKFNPESDFIINPNLQTYWRVMVND